MRKGRLILQPTGGLANRMRVISVLYTLCKEVRADFIVRWAKNAELGASWSDLFEEPEFPIIEVSGMYPHGNRSRKWYRRLPHQLWMYLHGYTWLPYEDVYALTAVDTPENSANICEEWKRRLQSGEYLFICTGDNLGVVNDLSMFQPIKKVQNYIEDYLSTLRTDSVPVESSLYGIHIRRTDNTWAIESSPLSLFEKMVTETLKKEPNAHFYLATDDQYTIEFLIGKFGREVIHVRDKNFDRGSVSGIQDAMVDMWILSQTKMIYGSFFSSFSEMASWIGGIELIVLKKEKQ